MTNDTEKQLKYMAKYHSVSEAQIALAWIMAKGAIPIPRTNDLNHLAQIIEMRDIKLPQEDVNTLDFLYPVVYN
jgi:diketogulonate reductase-like aldo/keto reductase